MTRRLLPIIVCVAVAAAIAPVLGYFAGQTFVRQLGPTSAAAANASSPVAAKPANASSFDPRMPAAAAAARQAAAKPAGANASAQTARPSEVRKMIDSYALMQAQEQLKISREKSPAFLEQYKNLQELRRTSSLEHLRLIQQLQKNSAGPKAADGQLKDNLKALHDFEEKSHADVRKTYDEIDKILDVHQQARFRVFEQQMNQRMAQLAARARQANTAKPAATKAVK
jgi:hypothetical protein